MLQFFLRLWGGISQISSCFVLLVYILTLPGSSFRKRSNVVWGTRMCFFLWSRCWCSCRINRRPLGFTITVRSYCSHRRGRSIRNVRPYKFFAMKNTPVEGVNSGNLEPCFDVPRRSREIQRRVDSTRNVIEYIVIVRPGWLVTQASHARLSRMS